MKIRAIDTTILSVPTPTPIALEYPEHRLVVASIETDEGPSGRSPTGSSSKEIPLHSNRATVTGACLAFEGYRRCTMHKFITIAAALAVGTMWSIGPACAQTTTDRTDTKAESTKDTIKDKAES